MDFSVFPTTHNDWIVAEDANSRLERQLAEGSTSRRLYDYD